MIFIVIVYKIDKFLIFVSEKWKLNLDCECKLMCIFVLFNMLF